MIILVYATSEESERTKDGFKGVKKGGGWDKGDCQAVNEEKIAFEKGDHSRHPFHDALDRPTDDDLVLVLRVRVLHVFLWVHHADLQSTKVSCAPHSRGLKTKEVHFCQRQKRGCGEDPMDLQVYLADAHRGLPWESDRIAEQEVDRQTSRYEVWGLEDWQASFQPLED